MELSSPQDIHEVEADGTLRIPNVGGVGFALTAMPGNAGGYPLHATVNEQAGLQLTIEGGHVYGQGLAVESLKVDVKPGGGRVGDRWRLTVQPTAADERTTRYPTDGRGLLRVAPPGARLLFSIWTGEPAFVSQLADSAPWAGNPASVDYVVCPAPTGGNTARIMPPGPGGTPGGPAWDVSGFSQVLFAVEQYSSGVDGAAPHPGKSIQAFLGLLGSGGATARPFAEVPCGSVNQFGTPATGPTWAGGGYGHAYAGLAGAPIVTDFFAATPLRAPLARFTLRISGGPLLQSKLTAFGYGLRLYAVGW